MTSSADEVRKESVLELSVIREQMVSICLPDDRLLQAWIRGIDAAMIEQRKADPWESRELGADERFVGVIEQREAVTDDAREIIVNSLRSSKSWLKGYAEAFVDDFASRHARQVPEWRGALNRLLDHVDMETCRHEETHRGGAIWTICNSCGRQWADDRGGFIPYEDAPAVANARAMLAATPPAPSEEVPELFHGTNDALSALSIREAKS